MWHRLTSLGFYYFFADVDSSIRVLTASPVSTRSVLDEDLASLSELANKRTPTLPATLFPVAPPASVSITTTTEGSSGSNSANAPNMAPGEVSAELTTTPWQLDASLGVLGLSILGSTPSSTCLKAEWHQLSALVSSGCCSSENSSQDSPSETDNTPATLTGHLSWSQLSFHVLQPKDTVEAMEYSPFLGNLGGGFGSPTGLGGIPGGAGLFPSTPPFQQAPGIASAAGARVLRRTASAGAGSPSISGAGGGVGAGVASSTDGGVQINVHTLSPWPEPTLAPSEVRSMLPRYSANSAVSRYFSAADSEFEDAASDFFADGSKLKNNNVNWEERNV